MGCYIGDSCRRCGRSFSYTEEEFSAFGSYCRNCAPFPEPLCCDDTMVYMDKNWLCIWCERQADSSEARNQFFRRF